MVEFFSIILAFILGLAFGYLVKCLNNKDSSHKLPDGNMGWPLLGENLGFLKPHRSNSLGTFLQEHCSRYGRVFKSHLFGSPTIVSCDFELNMFILQNEGKLFPVNYPKVMHKILGKLCMLVVTGELHKKLKGIITGFLSASKSQSRFLNSVEMLALSRINSWGLNCNQVAFYKEANMYSINVMLKHLLSIDPDEPLAFTILENFETYIKGFVSFPLNIPGSAFTKAVKARIKLQSTIKDIMLERRNKGNVGSVEGGDLLDVVLTKENLSDEERVSIVMDVLYGGYETTTKLLSLIVYFLGAAPNAALERLKEEHQVIRKSKREGELLNWEDYRQMEFTQNVINEGTRCGNVVKFLHRKAVQDVKFKEFVIPAGWQVLPVLSAQHLDPNHFENPMEFDPFRWNDKSIGKKLAPFSGGPRLCPGADLAKVEIAFFLHHLVLNYRWKNKGNDHPIAFPYVQFIGGLLLDLEPIATTAIGKHS